MPSVKEDAHLFNDEGVAPLDAETPPPNAETPPPDVPEGNREDEGEDDDEEEKD